MAIRKVAVRCNKCETSTQICVIPGTEDCNKSDEKLREEYQCTACEWLEELSEYNGELLLGEQQPGFCFYKPHFGAPKDHKGNKLYLTKRMLVSSDFATQTSYSLPFDTTFNQNGVKYCTVAQFNGALLKMEADTKLYKENGLWIVKK